jgi:CRISPR/Cas system-associated exonuclease Cas4 (RecB family)
MILEKISRHNKENNLEFNKEEHKYFVNGVEFQSVTKFLKNFFPFDRKRIARQIAEKTFTTEDEILESWDKVKDNGAFVHDLIDKFCKKQELSKEELNKLQGVLKFFKENNYEIITSEIKVFSTKLKLAGTIDLIAMDKLGNLFIIDWKTNRKFIDKKEVFEMARKPLEEFSNNKFYQYSFQLSLYRLILEYEYKINIYDSFLVQINEEDYQIINTLDLTYDVKELLESYL